MLGGRLKEGRGWGGSQWGKLELFCLLSLSLSPIHLSLSSLCPASPVCLSVCLGDGEGKGGPKPQTLDLHLLGSVIFALTSPHTHTHCFLVLALFQAYPQPEDKCVLDMLV